MEELSPEDGPSAPIASNLTYNEALDQLVELRDNLDDLRTMVDLVGSALELVSKRLWFCVLGQRLRNYSACWALCVFIFAFIAAEDRLLRTWFVRNPSFRYINH